MADPVSAPQGFAYLFERFPSFTQTFCAREVKALTQQGITFPVFSIRRPKNEPEQDAFADVGTVHFLPEKFNDILTNDAAFRREARKGLESLRNTWGDEEQKRRVYEALWLGPIFQKAGIRHIHVHFAGTAARTAFWLKRLFGVNFSVTAHANDIFCDEPPELLAQLFEAARVVTTVSDFSVEFLRATYPRLKERFCRIYNGIETAAFPKSTFPTGRPLILGVGRYIEKKGFSDLVTACSKLGGRDFECQIIGGGPLEESLKAQAALLGIGDRVHIAGPKTEGEIKTLLARSRAFALPCVLGEDGAMDNLPTVIMEAMAAALPVVSTNLAAIPEMVIDGQTGYVVPEHDPDTLAARLATLLDDPVSACQLGAKGLERCLTHFDIQATSTALLDVFRTHGALTGCTGNDPALQAA